MSSRVDPAWLSIRQPFDDAALDVEVISRLRDWAVDPVVLGRPLRVVDLGSGTGVAIERLGRWLPDHHLDAFAVDRDPAMLRHRSTPGPKTFVHELHGDILDPPSTHGGPPDGTVDVVLAHAVADLVPLDAFAGRVAALLRPGGVAHLALTYDGVTIFSPDGDPDLESTVVAAYHAHMNRRRAVDPSYGGSTAGRRLGSAVARAGLELIQAGESWWDVASDRGPNARAVLCRMLGFVTSSLDELGGQASLAAKTWVAARRRQLASRQLRLAVRHVDMLVHRPG